MNGFELNIFDWVVLILLVLAVIFATKPPDD
jgi:hypothetical protein